MASYSYEALLNDNVRFLQGTQAQLNKYLPGSGDNLSGHAQEGAFYLTTDTHRLYVGRKVDTGTDSGKIFPVQVSAGITTVVDSGSLPAASIDAQKGDFYYIQDGNILAVLEEDSNGNKQWIQINAATQISSFSQTTSAADGADDTVLINSSVATSAGGLPAYVGLVEGNSNVTLTPGTKAIGTGQNQTTVPTIEISTKDTTYTVGTTASSTNNGATLGLKKDGGSTLDSSVTLSGSNDIGVTSTAAGAITIAGPNFTNKGVAANAAAQGFVFQLEYDSGNGSGSQQITHSTKSTLDPTITYGATSGYSAPNPAISTFQQAAAVHFANGNATLNVYTKEQSDQAITDAINDRLSAANAMTYMGTIKTSTSASGVVATAVIDTIATSGTGHNGDTYKAACDFTYNGVDVKKGDLVILRGNEVNGVIPSANLTIDIVPSGDEPFVGPSFSGDSNGNFGTTPTSTQLNLVDTKNSNSLIAGVNIPNTEKIRVTSTISNNNSAVLRIEHRTLTRQDDNDANTLVTSNSGNDDFGNSTVSFLALNDTTDILTDSYGHVTGVNGKIVSFTHNKLSSMGLGYSNETLASNSPLLSKSYISLSVTDTLTNSVNKSIALESKTLTIGFNGASAEADKAIAIDIKWGSF